MRTTKPVGTMPLPALNGGCTLAVNVEYDPQDFHPDAPADPINGRRPASVAFSVVGHVGGHTLDLGVRRQDVPVQGLPAEFDALVATEPLASLIAEYRDRLAHLTIQLARLEIATGDCVALALSTDDLDFLRHCLMLTELRWREAIESAETAAQRPPHDYPPPPGFMNIEPTPAGYLAAARRFRAELRRVQRLGTRLARLIDLARDATGEKGELE